MGCITNSAAEDSREKRNISKKAIQSPIKLENNGIELMDMSIERSVNVIDNYYDAEYSQSIRSDEEEKHIEFITPRGRIDAIDDNSSDDDILKGGAITPGIKQTEQSESKETEINTETDAKYDVVVLSVEHPGDLKINSSGMIIWNVQNNGNHQWKDSDLKFVSGDALSISLYHVPNLQPAEIGVISVVFDTFDIAGIYQSEFRLRAGNGIEFGPYFMISVNIERDSISH